MAFRDWPNSDGQFMLTYPWFADFAKDWDKFLEHGHRLAGMLIGVWAIGLVVLVARGESRRSVIWLSRAVLLGVILQGLLGGFRVQLDERGLALVHGAFAAVVLSLIGSVATLLSPFWSTGGPLPAVARTRDEQADRLSVARASAMLLPVLMMVQFVAGGFIRHHGRGLHEHLGLGILVTIALISNTVIASRTGEPWMRKSAWATQALGLLQVSLGIGAWITKFGLAMAGYVATADSIIQVTTRSAPHGDRNPAGDDGGRACRPNLTDLCGSWSILIPVPFNDEGDSACGAFSRRRPPMSSESPHLEPRALAVSIPAGVALQSQGVRERIAEYVTLCKPRIATMVLVSVAVGFTVATVREFDVIRLCFALVGVGLSAAASSVLNQWYERETDARMPRTAGRPLPAGRISEAEALWFGCVLAVGATIWLAVTVNLLTAWLTLATCLLYVGVYTPLKKVTPLCTAIGAIPGAMPLVLGWTAAGEGLNSGALVLFGILYVWQFPHFLAIAWIYQDQYRGAGLRMLPTDGKRPAVVGMVAVGHALALIPVSLWARSLGLAGDAYSLTAVILGTWYLMATIRFAGEPDRFTARRLLWTSLAYLPMLLAALTIDHVRLLR